MLCHSKVWSRVWSHRCNVNMNPYISVCPVACLCLLSFLFFSRVFLSCLSIILSSLLSLSCFHLKLLDRHFRREVMSLSRAVCLDLSWPSSLAISYSYFCASIPLPLSASPILSFTSQYFKNPVVFLGHWDVWEELYLLFIICSCEANQPKLAFLKDSLLAWCFPSCNQRDHYKYMKGLFLL